jgi:hypothetical protein
MSQIVWDKVNRLEKMRSVIAAFGQKTTLWVNLKRATTKWQPVYANQIL